MIHYKNTFNISLVLCHTFELSIFEHKYIKGFADSRINLRKSATHI